MPRKYYRRKTKKRIPGEKSVKKVVRKELKRKGLKNPELNFKHEHRSLLCDDDALLSGASYLLSDIQQGDSRANRQGNQIQPMKMKIKGYLVQNGFPTQVRVMLVRWDARTAPTSLADILYQFGAVAGNQKTTCFYNTDNKSMFRVIWDKTYKVVCQGSSFNTTQSYISVNKTISLKSHRPIEYHGPNGTDISSGRYYVIYFSDVGSTNAVTFNCQSWFEYTDC